MKPKEPKRDAWVLVLALVGRRAEQIMKITEPAFRRQVVQELRTLPAARGNPAFRAFFALRE